MKLISTCLLALLFIVPGIAAQDIIFSEPIKPVPNNFAAVVGRVGDNYIVYEELPKPSRARALRIFNQKMQQVGGLEMLPVPPGAMNSNVCLYNDQLLLTYIEQHDDQFQYKGIKLNDRGIALGSPMLLDSFTDPLKRSGSWDLVTSADKKKLLVGRVNYQADSAFISTRIFDQNLALLEQAKQTIFVAHPVEMLGRLLLSNDGDIYLPVSPTAPGSMLSKFEILSKAYGSELYNSVVIDLKTRVISLASAILKVEDSRDTSALLISAICYGSKNKQGAMDGLFTARVKAATNQSRAVVNKLTGAMLKSETSNVNVNANSHIQLDDVFLFSNGGMMIVAKHRLKLSKYSRPGPQVAVNVTPRVIYDPTGFRVSVPAWDPDMFLTSRPEAQPSFFHEPYNHDIIVFYIDSALVMQHRKMIEKNPADLKRVDPAYLDFGTVNTSTAVHFLYREVQKGGGMIRNTRFTPNGELLRLPTLRTVDNLYKLMPSLSTQVGPRQVIIPGKYRGKIIYAKVDF